MIKKLLDALHDAADTLKPFTDPIPSTSLKWDGSVYAPISSGAFDPYAAKWWMALGVIEEMLAGQEGPMTKRQKQYLEKLLCGGMGSFNDFVLDENRLGAVAPAANTKLDLVRREICAALRKA